MPPQAPQPTGPDGSWYLEGSSTQTGAQHFSDLNNTDTDLLGWAYHPQIDKQETEIAHVPRAGLEGGGDDALTSSTSSNRFEESNLSFWTGSTESQGAFQQLSIYSDAQITSTFLNRRGARDDFNKTAVPGPPRSAKNQTSPLSDGSPPLLSTTSSIDCPAAPRAPSAPESSTSLKGLGPPRTDSRKVQFREMTGSSQQWSRSDGGSSVNSTSPGEMMKPDAVEDDRRPSLLRTGSNGPTKTSILRERQVDAFQDGKGGLPAEKGFAIQIGSELFRLSGASIMSDAPSYFSRFFEEQLRNNEAASTSVKTLYIDRDPTTFQDIALHLQGYRVLPKDGYHYVKLFADAQFYGLPKLIKQLFESEHYIRIGEKDFRISKDLFSTPGNTPNFFTLGFAIFAPTSGQIFPGLPNEGLFRPPSIEAPAILNRSASTFADILHMLRGYPIEIRSSEHRTQLLRDCRYYHFRGLEQQLIQHSISFNVARQRSEMVLRLEDVRQSGVSFVGDVSPSDRSPLAGWVNYSRPFIDETSYELVLELGDESTRISLRTMRAEFFGQTKARVTSLFQVVANKMNLPTNVPLGLMMSTGGVAAQPVSPGNTSLSDDLVKVAIERDAHVVLDDEEYDTANLPTPPPSIGEDAMDAPAMSSSSTHNDYGGSVHLHPMSRSPSLMQPSRKRARRGSLDEFGEWVIRRGQWRLRVQPRPDQDTDSGPAMEIIMMAVKLDAISGQRGRNAGRAFLN